MMSVERLSSVHAAAAAPMDVVHSSQALAPTLALGADFGFLFRVEPASLPLLVQEGHQCAQ